MAGFDDASDTSDEQIYRPSIVDEMYPQEIVIHNQKEKQEPRLMHQMQHFPVSWEEEKSLVGQVLTSDDFVKNGSTDGKWLYAGFFPGGYENRLSPEISEKWQPMHTPSTPFGIQLSNFALQLNSPVTLQAVALHVHISIRLKGESTFWIFTRGEGIQDPEAVICKIRKEPECQRAFLIFGSLAGHGGSFRFFKKQELPVMEEPSADAVACDYLSLKINFLDNGDDRVIVDVTSEFYVASSTSGHYVTMSCSYFIPYMRDTHLELAGNGDSVEVRKVKVVYKERLKTHAKPGSDRKDCCVLA